MIVFYESSRTTTEYIPSYASVLAIETMVKLQGVQSPSRTRFESLMKGVAAADACSARVYLWFRWAAHTFFVYKHQQCKNCSETRETLAEEYAEGWPEDYCTYCHNTCVRDTVEPESPKSQLVTCHGSCQRRFPCNDMAEMVREDGTDSGHFCKDCHPWGPFGEPGWR